MVRKYITIGSGNISGHYQYTTACNALHQWCVQHAATVNDAVSSKQWE